MAITIKILVAFVFTALFIVFSVHCRPTTASIPGICLFFILELRKYLVLCFILKNKIYTIFNE